MRAPSPILHNVYRRAIAFRVLSGALGLLALAACDSGTSNQVTKDTSGAEVAASAAAETMMAADKPEAAAKLAAVLAAQSNEVKGRYEARHPEETLMFFGIEPGMTVIEGDPSGGWYSNILYSYLGESGVLVGADYPMKVYELFDYYSEEELAEKARWADSWPDSVAAAGSVDGAAVEAFAMGSMPAALEGTVDAALLIRVLHNLADFEAEGAYLSATLREMYRALKPGGVVGIVQHQAPETHSEEWASGASGYLKKSFVVAAMEAAGFVFEAESSINENPLDQPNENESVWRLAPTLELPEDPQLAAAYAAIGESNRMTLRFRKPARQ